MTKRTQNKFLELEKIAQMKVEQARLKLKKINDQNAHLEQEERRARTEILRCRSEIGPAIECAMIAIRHIERLQLHLEMVKSERRLILQHQASLANNLRSALGVQLQLEHIVHEGSA